MKPMAITKENFEAEIINSDIPVLLEFYASWCPTCRFFAPIMNRMAEITEGVKIAAYNLDNGKELAEGFGISTIPAVIIMDKGEVLKSHTGYIGTDELTELLKETLKK